MKKINFNKDWIYYKKGEEENAQAVHLPHDAMLYQKRMPKLKNGDFTAFFPSGDYYYVKTFFADESYCDKTVILEFEGVYMDSKVYLNGKEMGGCVYGYSNFYIDLTHQLNIGQENEIKVFVHCSQVMNSRWYPGNGIYRPVYLHMGNAEHVKQNGITIKTKSINPAVIEISIDAAASSETEVETEIFYQGKSVAEGRGTTCEITIPNAHLWDSDHPDLYEAKVSLKKNGTVLDEETECFGIRTLTWDALYGMKVNDKSIKLQGGCVHHDYGILGACEFERAAYRRIRIMKEAGFNAIRSAHNPMSKVLLRACDELGMYVMDEAFDSWRDNSGMYGYALDFEEEWRKDLEKMVIKDRNHPSVIMYSIGNEISDTARPDGAQLAGEMTELCHQLDSTRPVTVCPNIMMNLLIKKGVKIDVGGGKIPKKEDIVDPLEENKGDKVGGSAMINTIVAVVPTLTKLMMKPKNTETGVAETFAKVDIAGYNYGEKVYEGHHKIRPERIMVGSETLPPNFARNWQLVKKYPYVIGDFMWTGWDYLGEVGVGIYEYGKKRSGFMKPYPAISAYSGAIDLIGHPDIISYWAAIVWGKYKKPYIAVRPVNHTGEKTKFSAYRHTDAVSSWSWPGCEGKKARIEVYSQGHTIELFKNKKSLGKKELKEFFATFDTVYQSGTIEAVSYDKSGREISRAQLKSAGKETMLTVKAENDTIYANGEDLAFINVEVTDKNGIIKMLSEKKVSVSIEGAGTLLGVGSGNPKTTERYTGNSFTTYQGRMQVVVRSGYQAGKIKVLLTADGLPESSVIIQVK